MLYSHLPLHGAAFLSMFGVGMIVSLLPAKLMALSGSASGIGLLAPAFALTFVTTQLPMGRLADRFGFRPFLCLGYGLSALAGLIFCLADSPEGLLAGRMLQGLGEVPVWSLAPALLALHYPPARGRTMGLYNAAIHLGLTLGSFSGICLSPLCQGPLPFLLYALLCGLGGLAVTTLKTPAPAPKAHRDTNRPWTHLFRLLGRGEIRALFLGILLYGAGYGIFVTTIPGYLMSVKGLNQTLISLFFMLFYVGISLAQIVSGRLSDRWGRKPVILSGLFLTALGLVLFPRLPLVGLMGLLTLAALGLGSFCVAALARVTEAAPHGLKGTVSSCFYLFWGVGYFCLPLAMTGLTTPWGLEMGFTLLGLACLAQALWCMKKLD